MKNNTLIAKKLLNYEKYTCVICRDSHVYKSYERGIVPLLNVIDEKLDFNMASAADKVVGRAAAFLYIIIGIDELYAEVISEGACTLLEEHGIKVYFDNCVKQIINRQNTGICPMEDAVKNINEKFSAESAIRQRREELINNFSK